MNFLNDPLIMLIDDNEIDIFISRRLLQVEDVSSNVISFTSPLEALEYLTDNIDDEAKIPEVILLDIQMPEMNGFEFLEQFRSLPDQVRKKPVIYILSSTADPVDIQKGILEISVKDILNKPLDVRVLKKSLSEIF